MNRCLFAVATALVAVGISAHAGEGLQDQEDRFFIDAAQGNDANTGFRASPLQTIQEGINRANEIEGGDVVVAAGTYSETLTLASNVAIRGGFDPVTWTRNAKGLQAESIIEGEFTAITGIDVTGILFEGFVVKAMDAGNQVQISSIALSLHNSADVIVRQNTFMPGNGGYGQGGRDGFEGDRGGNGGDGRPLVLATDFTDPPQGGTGGSGASPNDGGKGGNAGKPAIFSESIFAEDGQDGQGNPGPPFGAGGERTTDPLALANGQDGRDGVNGLPGIDGKPGPAVGTFAEGAYITADGGSAQATGHGGGGGGGGGSYGYTSVTLAIVIFTGASGGGGGSGGGAGGNGVPAQGGGASIGILLTESMNIQITDNEFVTGNGGSAGSGGFGVAGGQGGSGGDGGTGVVDTGSNLGANGGDGGNGGRGGMGADGGNGGGGPSIGIAEDRTTISMISENIFTLGIGGLGGSSTGTATPAPNGLVAETFKDPGAMDINEDLIVNAVDVQLVINGALGLSTFGLSTDVDGDNNTNAVDVQLVINAALGQ